MIFSDIFWIVIYSFILIKQDSSVVECSALRSVEATPEHYQRSRELASYFETPVKDKTGCSFKETRNLSIEQERNLRKFIFTAFFDCPQDVTHVCNFKIYDIPWHIPKVVNEIPDKLLESQVVECFNKKEK